jgi:hypothetical protein
MVCAATGKQAAQDTRSDKSAGSATYDFDFTSWTNLLTSDSSISHANLVTAEAIGIPTID